MKNNNNKKNRNKSLSSHPLKLHFGNEGSVSILYLSSRPSVMYLILVELEVTSSNLIEYPTFCPTSTPHSSATLFATVTAATRRGWVTPIALPSRQNPALNRNCGISKIYRKQII